MKYAVVILQIQNSDKLAFQRRDNKAPTDANVLSLFGGGMEGEETPLEGAYRELQEETSLNIPADALTFLAAITVDARVFNVFTAVIPDAPFEVYEGVGFECYTMQEFLARDDISPTAARLLRGVTL